MKLYVIGSIIGVLILMSTSYLQYQQASNYRDLINQLHKKNIVLESMIQRDDKLLNALLHGTWDRSCEYEVIPGELLADGSIRESLIQHCE